MRERLPNIIIKPDVSPKEFMNRLYHTVAQQQVWQVKRFDKGLRDGEGSPSLGLVYTSHKPKIAEDLTAHFDWYENLDKDRIRVGLVAHNLGVEDPTYDSYVVAANMLKPLLALYNRLYKARVRLNIQSREDLAPKLPPIAKRLFGNFVSIANKCALHPSDWEPFYEFINACHVYSSKLKEDDIKYLLFNEGFDKEHAIEIALVYGHGRAILKGRPHGVYWHNFDRRIPH